MEQINSNKKHSNRRKYFSLLAAVVSVRVEGTASQGQKIPDEFKKFFCDYLPDQPENGRPSWM
ncbi:hypothetical protein, partial [Escherichia coli]|uniref:hypothetical protein n=1 Tax=Escherichia coli TaxID=562 RepID=UPI002FBD773A